MTPTLPTEAKGAATSWWAWLAIMYPPEAAYLSTHTVVKIPGSVDSRRRCAAASPNDDTLPPGDWTRTTTSRSTGWRVVALVPNAWLRCRLSKNETMSAKCSLSGPSLLSLVSSTTTTVRMYAAAGSNTLGSIGRS
jgi:hypothetical protein